MLMHELFEGMTDPAELAVAQLVAQEVDQGMGMLIEGMTEFAQNLSHLVALQQPKKHRRLEAEVAPKPEAEVARTLAAEVAGEDAAAN